MPRIAVNLRIEGRVQGVGYRWWTQRQATALGLAGWVRNLSDGTVEIYAAGDAGAVEALAAACGEGPRGAQVRAVWRSPAEDDGSQGFEERGTR